MCYSRISPNGCQGLSNKIGEILSGRRKTMNLSSALLILLIAFAGLGFIGYDDLHTHQELENSITQIKQDADTITSLNNQITDLKNTIAQEESENASLKQQIDEDVAEINKLNQQIAQLTQQIISSTSDSARPNTENNSAPANASTPAQAASVLQPASSTSQAAGLPGSSMNLALLSPVLLIPLVLVTLKVTQSKKSLTGYNEAYPVLGMEVKSYRTILTKDEMDQVILSRRLRQISK
jgi:predicted PurR-regulated permease PerM